MTPLLTPAQVALLFVAAMALSFSGALLAHITFSWLKDRHAKKSAPSIPSAQQRLANVLNKRPVRLVEKSDGPEAAE